MSIMTFQNTFPELNQLGRFLGPGLEQWEHDNSLWQLEKKHNIPHTQIHHTVLLIMLALRSHKVIKQLLQKNF